MGAMLLMPFHCRADALRVSGHRRRQWSSTQQCHQNTDTDNAHAINVSAGVGAASV